MGEGRGSIVEWLGILRIVEARDFCGEWGHETAGRRRLDEEDDALNAGKQSWFDSILLLEAAEIRGQKR
jgi:hypothetical protein